MQSISSYKKLPKDLGTLGHKNKMTVDEVFGGFLVTWFFFFLIIIIGKTVVLLKTACRIFQRCCKE